MTPEDHAEKAASDLAGIVNRIAASIERELSPGDVADLRRLSPGDPSAPAFWRMAGTLLADELRGEGSARSESERRWAAILSGMASTRGLHRPGRRAGEALAEAGYSELRFVRLLRARDVQLLGELRGAARYLDAKAVAFDWRDLVLLVLSEGRTDEEEVRRRIARSYFQQLSREERQGESK